MNHSPAIRTIRFELASGTQSLIYQETLTVDALICFIEIESDSSRFQCVAKATVWDQTDLRWHDVTNIHFSLMKTKEGLIYHKGASARDFVLDRDELLRRLVEILATPVEQP